MAGGLKASGLGSPGRVDTLRSRGVSWAEIGAALGRPLRQRGNSLRLGGICNGPAEGIEFVAIMLARIGIDVAQLPIEWE